MNRAVSKWLSTVEPTHTELYEGTKQVSESDKGKAKYYKGVKQEKKIIWHREYSDH